MSVKLQQAIRQLSATLDDRRSDAGLIAAFLRGVDRAAFAELVRRHGPMVLGVCRRLLGQTPDAEDAFQATFLVLLRRARHTSWRESLGPWLYGVALRVARRARLRRFTSQRQASEMAIEPAISTPEPDDSAAVLDEELAGMPDTYRQPLVLCELQGLSRKEAARELGLSEGTLSSRLGRGRRMLRERLTRRGVTPVVAGLAVTVPPSLASATVQNAAAMVTGAAGMVSAGIVLLMEGAVKAMIVKWKLAVVMVAACLGLTGFGAWQSSISPGQAVAAEPPRVQTTPPLEQPGEQPPVVLTRMQPPDAKPDAVATIFGDVPVTREAFTDHLIRRYGKKELELFVTKQVIGTAFGRKGWSISADDVLSALDADCKAVGVTREQFFKEVIPRYGKTSDVWIEDVITPRLMLARLCKTRVMIPTDAELRAAFEQKYGEKREGRMILWRLSKKEAAAAYAVAAASGESFDRSAREQRDPNLAASHGSIAPIPRVVLAGSGSDPEVVKAVGRLQPGEITLLIETEQGFVAFKCDRIVPMDRSKSFDVEKPMLLAEVVQARINREIPKLADELKREANPRYHLTFPDPAILPNPVPAKPKKP